MSAYEARRPEDHRPGEQPGRGCLRLRLSHGGHRQGIQEYAVWHGATPAADKPAEIPANSEKAATSLLQNITVGPVSSGDAAAVVAVCKEHDTTADSYTNAENHLQIICIRSVVQAVADAVLAVCKERKLTDAKLYTSHWA